MKRKVLVGLLVLGFLVSVTSAWSQFDKHLVLKKIVVEKMLEGKETAFFKLKQPERQANGECQIESASWWYAIKDDQIFSRKKILDVCNDGYGASMIGQDDVQIDKTKFTHTRHGGSAARWSIKTTVIVDPFELVEQEYNSYWTTGSVSSKQFYNWRNRSGHASWYQPFCGSENSGANTEKSETLYQYNPIIQMALPENYFKSWQQQSLGNCATVVYKEYDRFLMDAVVSDDQYIYVDLFWRHDQKIQAPKLIFWHFGDGSNSNPHCIDRDLAHNIKKWELPLHTVGAQNAMDLSGQVALRYAVVQTQTEQGTVFRLQIKSPYAPRAKGDTSFGDFRLGFSAVKQGRPFKFMNSLGYVNFKGKGRDLTLKTETYRSGVVKTMCLPHGDRLQHKLVDVPTAQPLLWSEND